jgi:hypothetical protein
MAIDLLDLTLLAPPFGADGDTPVTVTDDFRTALRARLLAAPGLEPLVEPVEVPGREPVGNRVYWSTVRAAPFPHIRIYRIGGDRRMENSADGGPFWRRLQFSILSDDDEEAETISEAAYAALEWDANDPLLFVEGYEMARFPDELMGPDEQSGAGPNGDDVWMSHFDVEFLMGKS